MDFFPSTTPLFFVTLLSAVVILAVIYNRFYPELFARIRIHSRIGRSLDKTHYQLVENIDIICADGQRLHIKQLLVSHYGLFIIETCHFRGTIYGSHHQVKWLSKGSMHSIPFHNPHMTQQSTVKLLANYLHLSPSQCNVVMVFTGNSHFPHPFQQTVAK